MNRLGKFTVGLIALAMAVASGPEGVLRLNPLPDVAFAKQSGRGGGYMIAPDRPPAGARARPSRPPGAAGRPSNRPAGARPLPQRPPQTTRPGRPSQKPATPPAANLRPRPGQPVTLPADGVQRPARPPSAGDRPRPERPPGTRPPGQRPPGARPPGERPPGARPPGGRPPGARPPGQRPPGWRPPSHRPPPSNRPPGWQPPAWRPPTWHPPHYRPPHYRPPHYKWGKYYYSPNWGWYFTASLIGATLVYSATLPSDKNCSRVDSGGETLYACDGVLYRATNYKGDLVYEVVSPDPGEAAQAFDDAGLNVLGLQLTSPMTSGPAVRELQMALTDATYDVGTIDGVFGSGTEAALMWYQYDYGLEVTGIVDDSTAQSLGLLPPPEEQTEFQPFEFGESDPAAAGSDGTVAAPGSATANPVPEQPAGNGEPQYDDAESASTDEEGATDGN